MRSEPTNVRGVTTTDRKKTGMGAIACVKNPLAKGGVKNFTSLIGPEDFLFVVGDTRGGPVETGGKIFKGSKGM